MLKLKNDGLLSRFGFKRNLRRYIMAMVTPRHNVGRGSHWSTFWLNISTCCGIYADSVGCQINGTRIP